ncbi:hypothetical protein [Bartonella gabonensis]|uniref:hypothetical protein n=1 Tax=Bartonella gabonensis TaxID=2699889 RepID=UPI00158ECDE8|nr:hypothetical protein [Bartonella gabonensis]
MCWLFIKPLRETTTITQLAFCLVILKGVRRYPLHHIHKIKWTLNIDNFWLGNMKERRDATTEFRVPLSSEAIKILK